MSIEATTAVPENRPASSNWRAIVDAIRGTEADYTDIPLGRAIVLLAVPMILELVMESTFAIVDVYFVSRLGLSAVATVGLTETMMFLLYSIAMGLGTAVTAIVARRIGEKHKEEAAKTAAQSIVLSLLVSVPFSIAGLFFAKDLLILMGANQWAIEHGYRFTQIMLSGNLVIILLFVINAIFRGAGDAAISMRVLWIANGINILLCPLFIFGWGPIPAYGVEGSAMATTCGRGFAVLIQVWTLFRGAKHIRTQLSQFRWDTSVMLTILRTALGGIGQMIVAMTSWIFVMRILASVSDAAVAASTVVVRLMMFTLMPAWGFSNAAATLVGQNLGAGRPDRAESAVWKIGAYNMIYLLIVSYMYFAYNHQLMSIFTTDALMITIGSEWLRILSYSYFVYGWWMVSTQAFNGAGDTATPTKINIVFFWLFQIPLCYLLSIVLHWQHSGVYWGVFVSETSVGLFSLWLFRRGRWKIVQV